MHKNWNQISNILKMFLYFLPSHHPKRKMHRGDKLREYIVRWLLLYIIMLAAWFTLQTHSYYNNLWSRCPTNLLCFNCSSKSQNIQQEDKQSTLYVRAWLCYNCTCNICSANSVFIMLILTLSFDDGSKVGLHVLG